MLSLAMRVSLIWNVDLARYILVIDITHITLYIKLLLIQNPAYLEIPQF